jgi:membrane protease YdiL (CAAX protease family)
MSHGRALGWFFALAFGITWLLQLPGVLAGLGLLPGPLDGYLPFAMLGIFGPLAAATFLTAREGGQRAVRELYSGLGRWRAPVSVYLVAIVLPGLLLAAILSLLGAAGREGPVAYLPDGSRLVLAFVISIAEEVGWRGYALPRLQKRFGAFAASGLLGVLWALWHIPMFMAQGIPLALFLVMALFFTGGSLVFTWAYERSGQSLFVVVLTHVAVHLNNSHVALPTDQIPLVVHSVIYAALGLALVRPFGPSNARRARPSLADSGVHARPVPERPAELDRAWCKGVTRSVAPQPH